METEIDQSLGNVFLADPPELGRFGDLFLDQGRPHVARTNGVAGDAELGGLERHRLGEAEHAVLGRDIGRLERRGDQPVGRGDIDDPSPSPFLHSRQRRADHMEGAGEIDGDDGVPLVDGEFVHRRHMLNARIVDDDVGGAERRPGGLHQAGDFIRSGHVGAVVADADTALIGETGARRLDVGLVAEAVEHDVVPVRGQRPGNAQPDAAGRSGDDGGLVVRHLFGPLRVAPASAPSLSTATGYCTILHRKIHPGGTRKKDPAGSGALEFREFRGV